MSESGASYGGSKERMRNVGGTPGGGLEFLLGLVMIALGGYMLLTNVVVHTSQWRLWGMANGFGISLLPLLFGVGFLFYNGRSKVGWFLTGGGALFILAGILMQMDIYFQRTTLFHTLVMLILLVGGLGLVARGLRPHSSRTG